MEFFFSFLLHLLTIIIFVFFRFFICLFFFSSFFQGHASDGTPGGNGEGETDPETLFRFSSCGDYPHVLEYLQQAMMFTFPGSGARGEGGGWSASEGAGEKGMGEVGVEEEEEELSDVTGSSGAFVVYETMGKLLKRLPLKMRTNPVVARTTLLTVIHLFRRMLERHPILGEREILFFVFLFFCFFVWWLSYRILFWNPTFLDISFFYFFLLFFLPLSYLRF